MGRIVEYAIVAGESTRAICEDAWDDKLPNGWEPVGGVVPNQHVDHRIDSIGERVPWHHTTYLQTWVKREEE